MVLLACLVLLLCAAASFFFAVAEVSLFSLGKWRIRQLSAQHPESGKVIGRLMETPQDLLATIALGNTLCNALMVAVVVAGRADWHASATWLGLGALLVLLLLGCEVIPKTLAVREPETWAVRVAPLMAAIARATRPLRRLAQWLNRFILAAAARRAIVPTAGLTDEEYRELVELACQQGTLAAVEKDIILQIIGLDRRTAGEVMKPRARMVAVSDDASREEMLALARRHKHQRLPIFDESPDTIVGILNTRALLLNPDIDLAEVIEFPSFVPASMNLLQLFKSLQRQRRGLAIVLDEFGGTAGIVTMEDILEAVVGDIRNEGEAEGFVMEKIDAHHWRVNATMRLEDFAREYPALEDLPGVETLGGLVVALREVVPAVGESVEYCGLRLTVTAADERRVRELLVERLPAGKGKGWGGMNTGTLLLLVMAALAASFFFSGMEAGVLGLNRLRLRQLQRQGNRRARMLYQWLEQPEPFLWTILVGNTLANFAAVTLSVLLLQQMTARLDLPPLAQQLLFWLAFLGVVLVVLYGLCDLLPKVMFRLFPTRLCLWLAPLFKLTRTLLSPGVVLVTWLAEGLAHWSGGRRFTGRLFASREELRLFVEEYAANLTSEERAMINRVLDLQNRRVGDMTIPWSEAVTTTLDAPLREALQLCREHGVSRLPVWQNQGAARRIAGVLSLRAVLYREGLNPDLPVRHFLRPALYLDENLRLEAALRRMQRAGERVAIVLDGQKREIGLISLQDILRAVFGEVQL